jgi:E3 ubiquitin-protein ligase SDIR1
MYATCQLLQEQARACAAAASGLLGQAELRFNVPPSIAIATRGRLQGLRLQLALLDQEFEELGIILLSCTFGFVFGILV